MPTIWNYCQKGAENVRNYRNNCRMILVSDNLISADESKNQYSINNQKPYRALLPGDSPVPSSTVLPEEYERELSFLD